MKYRSIAALLGLALSSTTFAQTMPTTPTQPTLPQTPSLRTQPNEWRGVSQSQESTVKDLQKRQFIEREGSERRMDSLNSGGTTIPSTGSSGGRY